MYTPKEACIDIVLWVAYDCVIETSNRSVVLFSSCAGVFYMPDHSRKEKSYG